MGDRVPFFYISNYYYHSINKSKYYDKEDTLEEIEKWSYNQVKLPSLPIHKFGPK